MHLARRAVACLFLIAAATASASAGTVTISSPANGASATSPVRVTASASDADGVKYIQVYVDGAQVFHANTAKVDTQLAMATGDRRVTVQAKDSLGNIFKSTVNIKVGTSSSSTTSSKTISNIDHMTGWQSCTECAGIGGDGPVAKYAMKQNVASPSLDGKAVEFFLGGDQPYANALWWKQLGGQDWASNFRYELSYYITNPSAAQALEFDVNQTRSGKWYIFGTECDFKDKKVWKVYDPSTRHWMTTGIACTVPKAYTWHHLAFEFRRTSNAGTQFVSVTINGQKHYFSRTYPARSASSSTVNVAFQMDGNKYQVDYKV
jgi:hypothetical protein